MAVSSQSIRAVLILLVAVFLALWLGVSIATDQKGTIAISLMVAGGTVCLLLGQRIWLLLLFLMVTHIPLIRGLITPQLGQILFVGMSIALFLLRRLKLDNRWTELDFWRLAIVAMVVQVYLRNPVGLGIFGSENVGARPYIITFIAIATGFILSRYRVPVRELRWALWATVAGAIFNFPISWLRGRVLGIGRVEAAEGVTVVDGGIEQAGASRVSRFENLAEIIAKIMVWRVSPLKAVIHPFWAVMALLSIFLAAASGYRNAVASVGLIYLFGIYYRGGWLHLAISSGIFAAFLAVLAVVNSAYPLPPNVQRALSPFPGTWESRYVADAEASSDWRYEMWEEVLTSDQWIHSKVLGDGIGMTQEEMRRVQNLAEQGHSISLSGLTVQQESMLITGNYHSGPIHTIRIMGYVGLVIVVLALIRMMVHTHRMIQRCRGTEWWGLSLFFGVPMMAFPIFWMFIFGTFEEVATFFFVYSGLLDLLHKNLPVPEPVKARRRHHVPMAMKQARPLVSGS